ncbi:MAG: hypothetical protein R2867_05350 [Caldilineaceae bacterium]
MAANQRDHAKTRRVAKSFTLSEGALAALERMAAQRTNGNLSAVVENLVSEASIGQLALPLDRKPATMPVNRRRRESREKFLKSYDRTGKLTQTV